MCVDHGVTCKKAGARFQFLLALGHARFQDGARALLYERGMALGRPRGLTAAVSAVLACPRVGYPPQATLNP